MTDQPVLHILFILILALFIPIGLARGVIREVFVTAAIFAGASLAAAWGRPWGDDLADLLEMRADVARFVVAAALLLGTVGLLGYAASAVAGLPRARLRGRLAGSVLAVVNGVLLLAFVLREIERFLADAGTLRTLDESRIASILQNEFGWVLLAAAGTMGACLAGAALLGASAEDRLASQSAWQTPASETERKHRLRWGRDDGKVEPQARGFDPATQTYAGDRPHHAQTMPIAAVDPASWSMDRAGQPGGGQADWVEVVSTKAASQTAMQSRCERCGERLQPLDVFCPRCGHSVGK